MAKIKLSGRKCQCGACAKYFKALSTFDKHRVGDHGKDRRCMTSEEMEAAGMMLTSRGLWVVKDPRMNYDPA